jgi:hypothetical protein
VRSKIVKAPIQVECYSGHSYAQEPRAFEWRGHRYKVVRVVKRWRTPTGPAFRVEASSVQSRIVNGNHQVPKTVDLHYLEIEDFWTMDVHS